MSIEWQCDCGKTLKAPDSAVGKLARCPHCQRISGVPEPTPTDIKAAPTVDMNLPAGQVASTPVSAIVDLRPRATGPPPSTTIPVSAAALAHANARRRKDRLPWLIGGVAGAAVVIIAVVLIVMSQANSPAEPAGTVPATSGAKAAP